MSDNRPALGLALKGQLPSLRRSQQEIWPHYCCHFCALCKTLVIDFDMKQSSELMPGAGV